MFYLAHISDPHLAPMPAIRPIELVSKRLIGWLNWQRNRHHTMTTDTLDNIITDITTVTPNHIAITGDLMNIALDEEIQTAYSFLKRMNKIAETSVIPGNHDAYVRKSLSKIVNIWHPFLSSDQNQTYDANHHPPFPFPYIRKRKNIAIIGLSTAIATPPFMATGQLGRQQIKTLIKILTKTKEEGLFRIILIHHPPHERATKWHKRLIDASDLREAIAHAGTELILHGHTHQPTRTTIRGPENNMIPVIGVSSASQGKNGTKPLACWNLFAIGGKSGTWHCQMSVRGFQNEDMSKITKLGSYKLY